MDKILGFDGDYRWLSNFTYLDEPIVMCNLEFKTTENVYQAMKCRNLEDMAEFVNITPSKAKRLGRTIPMVDDWDTCKYDVMYHIQMLKYQQPKFKSLLLQTGDLYIEETNTWNDTYWGVCNGIGLNNLGKIIMDIRETLND